MRIKSEEDILRLVEDDEWMMDILKTVQTLKLTDWWVCAGFVRSKIWDVLHGFDERTVLPDIDVIYFDPTNVNENEEKKLEMQLKSVAPSIPWSIKNQARMHVKNNLPPYSSSIDGMANFPETATALGLTLGEKKHIRLAAPYGISDVINLEVKPIPRFMTNEILASVYEERVREKNWIGRWHKLKISHI
ncbi:nucleotidyltransferase family protein [Psychrobacillus sp.]|uniref:nucleotidyltransferase family protein n=1 Tax=Psychrobacillus sp. TaxID=1871623 RepID=UPI0028BD33A2|nr:nucleotidyltransferase family protein [Psychrobacillus sp.]